MGIVKKLLLGGVAAASLLAVAGGTAMALRSLDFNRREIALLSRAASFGSVATGTVAVCEVALNSTLDSLRHPKREGVVGRVAAVVLRCSRGLATTLSGPWSLKYKTISGTLPRITSLTEQIERARFLVESGPTLENRCLILDEIEYIQEVIGGTFGRLEVDPFKLENITVARLGGLCPMFAMEVRMSGSFEPVNGPITVSLV